MAAYELRIGAWSSDMCSSDLAAYQRARQVEHRAERRLEGRRKAGAPLRLRSVGEAAEMVGQRPAVLDVRQLRVAERRADAQLDLPPPLVPHLVDQQPAAQRHHDLARALEATAVDLKDVVWGKSVAVTF